MKFRTLLLSTVAGIAASTAMAQTSSEVITKIGENAGKVGYPTAAAFATYKSAVEASDATDDSKTTALTTLLQKANIVLPEDGKAYYIHPVNKSTTSTTTYTLYTNSSNKLHFTNATAGSDHIFYAHKVEDNKYVFTNNKGYYMTFRADGKYAAGDQDGVTDSYSEDCLFSIYPMQYSSSNNWSTASSSITSAKYETLGLVLLQAKMYKNASTLESSNYLMTNTSQSSNDNPFHNGSANDIYYTTDGNTCAYAFEEATQENAFTASEMKLNEETIYLGTYSSPFPVAIPTGCEAYVAALNTTGDKVSLTQVEDAIPANTGVVIKATSTEQLIPVARTTETLPTISSNLLVATTGEAIDASTNAFILNYDTTTKEAGFYKLSSTSRTVKKFKAYLNIATSGSALKMALNFGDTTTGIESVNNATPQGTSAIYDLSGRRVSQPTHGLYIIGGKKVLVK